MYLNFKIIHLLLHSHHEFDLNTEFRDENVKHYVR